MLTQDEIDAKFENLKGDAKTNAQRDIELKEEISQRIQMILT
jgi:hypothetical protein